MSQRAEWYAAINLGWSYEKPGGYRDDNGNINDEPALVIGGSADAVFSGSYEELEAMLLRGLDTLRRHRPRPRSAAAREIQALRAELLRVGRRMGPQRRATVLARIRALQAGPRSRSL